MPQLIVELLTMSIKKYLCCATDLATSDLSTRTTHFSLRRGTLRRGSFDRCGGLVGYKGLESSERADRASPDNQFGRILVPKSIF